MRWRKLGMIFCPDGSSPWMRSHAALPLPVRLEGDAHRIFFSARDEKQRSHVGYVDVNLRDPSRVLAVSAAPLLAPGEAGAFDDSGVSLGSLVDDGTRLRLYYMGWNLGVRAPWRNSIGLAEAQPGRDGFRRYSAGPVMDRSPEDPYTLSYPWVMRESSGLWRMWYGSHLSWGSGAADMTHAVKHAVSDDGIAWRRNGKVVIGPDNAGTQAIARPCVIRDGDVYRMWYAYRGDAYRIGYAESGDGLSWTRKDGEAGIATAPSGWDSEMLCYPCVFDHAGNRYMLYNGNGYGVTGFGLAISESP
jgi:hypothetical protein